MSDGMATYSDLSMWFTVAVPRDWVADLEDDVLQLRPADGGFSLTLQGLWLPTDAPSADDVLRTVLAGFPARRNETREAPLEECRHEHSGIRGEILFRPAGSTLSKLFRRGEWLPWEAWAFVRPPLAVTAWVVWSCDGDSSAHRPSDAEVAQLHDVLRRLEITDTPALPRSIFAQKALELARRDFPLVESRLVDGFQLEMGESRVNLTNFYRSYVSDPERLEELLRPALATVVRVQGWGDAQIHPPLSDVRDRIMPMLYPRAVWEESMPTFVAQPWREDLVTLYVVDESDAYWYVSDSLLAEWGLSPEELHRLALHNLDEYFSEHPMPLMADGEAGDARHVLVARPDAYNATRLLSADFRSALHELLGPEFLAGIPNRDFMIAFRPEDPSTVHVIGQRVAADFEQVNHPLSPRLFRFQANAAVDDAGSGEPRE